MSSGSCTCMKCGANGHEEVKNNEFTGVVSWYNQARKTTFTKIFKERSDWDVAQNFILCPLCIVDLLSIWKVDGVINSILYDFHSKLKPVNLEKIKEKENYETNKTMA